MDSERCIGRVLNCMGKKRHVDNLTFGTETVDWGLRMGITFLGIMTFPRVRDEKKRKKE